MVIVDNLKIFSQRYQCTQRLLQWSICHLWEIWIRGGAPGSVKVVDGKLSRGDLARPADLGISPNGNKTRDLWTDA